MPDKIIEIPSVGRIAFPDSMTDDEINAAAGKLYREKNPDHPPPDPQHSWIDTAVDWLPTAAGAAGGLIGGIGGTVAGMGVGGVPGAIGGAALGGAAGEAAKQLLNRARGVQAPSSPSAAASAIGTQAVLQGGAEAVGGAVGAVMKPVGAALMQSAIKPGLKATTRAIFKGVATEDLPIVKTLLKEGINVTPGGIAKLDRIINASNDEIKDAVASIPGDINPFKVTQRLGETAKRFANQVNPEQDLEAVSRAGQQFLEQHGGAVIDPAKAQALKSGTYQQLKQKAYGELKGADIEAQKALARGLKEEIEAEYAKSLPAMKAQLGLPGGVDIATANAREGAAITAKEAIAKRLAAAGNRDPASLAWLAHNPTAGLLFILERSPAVKSLIARGAYGAAGSVSKVSPQVIRGLVAAVATSDTQESQ